MYQLSYMGPGGGRTCGWTGICRPVFRKVPSLPLIKQLGWLNIQQMIEFETTKIVHKTLHNELPEYLQGLFTRVSDKCVRELRNFKLDLNLPLLKTSFGQKSFSFRGAKLWNKLGSEAKTTSSFSAFKKAITQN